MEDIIFQKMRSAVIHLTCKTSHVPHYLEGSCQPFLVLNGSVSSTFRYVFGEIKKKIVTLRVYFHNIFRSMLSKYGNLGRKSIVNE